MIVIKTAAEIASMRRAGRVVATLLQDVGAKVRPGVTTLELDQLAGQVLERQGATSPFIGYQPAQARKPYPGYTCMSVNEQVVHGVPGTRRLVDGDILTIDCGALPAGPIPASLNPGAPLHPHLAAMLPPHARLHNAGMRLSR